MNADIMSLQAALVKLGFDPGPLDGLWGRKTEAAMAAAMAADGVSKTSGALPWMTEALAVMGRHEARDKSELSAWLRSDGGTLGDPSKLPWCGDFVHTALRLALPSELFPGALGQNPYWARNWALFGVATDPTYGAVAAFERGSGGHVGFLVGQNEKYFQVLGGNQSNSVNISAIEKTRLLATRWPSTFARLPINLPYGNHGTISQNEV